MEFWNFYKLWFLTYIYINPPFSEVYTSLAILNFSITSKEYKLDWIIVHIGRS